MKSPSRRDGAFAFGSDLVLVRLALLLPLAGLILFFLIPMIVIGWRSLIHDHTLEIGLQNYITLMHAPGIWRAAYNSLILGASVTALSTTLGFALSYALERSAIRGKKVITALLNLPLIAPSLVLALGLIFLLGRNGLIGKILGIRPDPYGFWGLLVANTLYTLPFAILIIRAALRHGDARLYEAAEMMGAGGMRQFRDVTWPGARYGVLSAAFVVFTLTITDFGNAVVIGGNFNVLATEIYNQVSGQMRFGMGAVVGIALLVPSVLSVLIERFARQRQGAHGAESATPPRPVPHFRRDLALGIVTWTCALIMGLVIGLVVVGSFVKLWPYQMQFTLNNYNITMANAWAPLFTSVKVSIATALIGTTLVFMLSLGLRHATGPLAVITTLISAMPVAVPGLVLGLGYVFVFNASSTPLVALYGSLTILVLCNYYHYHSQAFLMMNTSARQIPHALEDTVAVMGGSLLHTIRDVYLPWLRITLTSVALFQFMMSMVTLSAVIFLVTPSNMLAAVTVMRLDEAGFTAQAAAYSTCIMAIVAASAGLLRLQVQRRGHP